MGNFYSLHFEKDEYLPKIRRGMEIELKNNVAYLDGICAYRLLVEPQVYEDREMSVEKLFFLYSNKAPWIAKEIDEKFYLYKGSIDKYSLNLTYDIDESNCYMSIEVPRDADVVVDDGRIITRVFKNDTQYCVVEVNEYANVSIIKESLITILEWDGQTIICK